MAHGYIMDEAPNTSKDILHFNAKSLDDKDPTINDEIIEGKGQ